MTDWQTHEREVQEFLGLSSTVASGNQFWDPGDGVSNKHPLEDRFPVMVDCKATVKKSFSLTLRVLTQWRKKAGEFGKIFLLPLRFITEDSNEDWVVLSLSDFGEMYHLARNPQEVPSTPLRTEGYQDVVEYLHAQCHSTRDPAERLRLIEFIETLEKSVPGGTDE